MIDIIDTHTEHDLIEVEYCLNGGDLQTCMITIGQLRNYYNENPFMHERNWLDHNGHHQQECYRVKFDEICMFDFEQLIKSYMEADNEITQI